MGNFDDLIPQKSSIPIKKSGAFDDLIPKRSFKDKVLDAGGGLMFLAGGGKDPEDTLPMVGQTVGSSIPGLNAFGGGVAGATAGQAMRQGIKAIRGTRNSPKRQLFGEVGKSLGLPQAPGIVNDLAGEASGTAITQGVFKGLEKLSKPVTNRLMIAALKPEKEALKRNPEWGIDAAKQGLWGTLKRMKGQAADLIDKNMPLVKSILNGKPQKINALQIASELDNLKTPYLNVGDEAAAKSIDELQQALLKKVNPNGLMAIEDAQGFKQDLYKVLKDSQWGKGQGEIPLKATARKQAAYGLRKEIEGAVPEVGPLNKKIGVGVEALEGINKQQQKSLAKTVLPWVETIGTVGSMATGNPAIAGAIIGRRIASSPTALSIAAQGARGFSDPLLQKAGSLGAAEIARRFNRYN